MTDLSKLARDDLDAKAAELGVDHPEDLDTKAEVLAAIEALSGGVQPQDWWPEGRNPALVHGAAPTEPPASPYVPVLPEANRPTVTREYLVTGEQPVAGHAPGQEFRAALPPAQEDALIWGGHISRTTKEEGDS